MDGRARKAALRDASTAVDVPGTPRSLRLDSVEVSGGRVRLSWSFLDPETRPGDPPRHDRRVRGELAMAMAPGDPGEQARRWWAEVQLAAAYRFKLQVDADWEPGAPFTPRTWSTTDAWEALLGHLGSYGAEVLVDDGETRVRDGHGETVYRIDPTEWAAYLNGAATADPPDPAGPADPLEIVPVATPLVDGLPQWAVDSLDEAAGAWGPVVGLVDGELVRLEA